MPPPVPLVLALVLSAAPAGVPSPAPARPPASPAAQPSASRPAVAPDLSAAAVLVKVRAANAALRAWAARFHQRRRFVHFDSSEEKTGGVSFKRGVGLRLDLDPPDEETVVVT